MSNSEEWEDTERGRHAVKDCATGLDVCEEENSISLKG